MSQLIIIIEGATLYSSSNTGLLPVACHPRSKTDGDLASIARQDTPDVIDVSAYARRLLDHLRNTKIKTKSQSKEPH